MNPDHDKTQVFNRLQQLILRAMKEHDDWADQRAKTAPDMEIEPLDAAGKEAEYFLKRWWFWLTSLFAKSRNTSTVSRKENSENTRSSHYYDEINDFSFSIDSQVSKRNSTRITKTAHISKQHTIKIRVGDSAPDANPNGHDSNF